MEAWGLAAVQPSTTIEGLVRAETTLPVDVLEFLSRGGATLLVKGEAGTGKTTFALELLRFFSGGEGCRGVYVTTRVGKEEIFEMYPWLDGSLSPECIIDATSPPSTELKIDLAAPDIYYRLPEPLKHVYDIIREIHPTGLVVFDSWDALVDYFEAIHKPYEARTWSRKELETYLLGLFVKENVNVILIAESATKTPLDYVVDGVIELERRYPRRFIREVIIRKLRGISIRQPRYLFTLHDGKFRSFEAVEPTPVILKIPEHRQTPRPLEDLSPLNVSTGIGDFDELTGMGFIKGSLNIFDVGKDVGAYYHTLSLPMIINWLNLGSGVVVVPSQSTPPILLQKYLSSWVSQANMEHLFIFRMIPGEIEAWPELQPPDRPDRELLRKKFEEYIHKRVVWSELGTTYSFVGFDSFEMLYSVEDLKPYLKIQADFIRDFGQVDMWVVREMQEELINVVAPMATTYWKVDMVDSTFTIQGINPPTNLHAVELSLDRGYPLVEFTLIN